MIYVKHFSLTAAAFQLVDVISLTFIYHTWVMRRGRLVSTTCNLIREGRPVTEGSVTVREGGHTHSPPRRSPAGPGTQVWM